VQYGEWHNLWRFPADIFLAPFSSDDNNLVLPWTKAPIPWFRFELYESHYGQLVTVALLLTPFLLWHFRRRNAPAPASERHVVLVAATAFFLLLMPLRSVPTGFSAYFPRYLLAFPVLILCATAVPLLIEVDRNAPALSMLTVAATVVVALTTIAAYASRDLWMPFNYVLSVARQTDRRIYPSMPVRAAFVLDHVAGQFDRVDVHGGHDTFLYPVYGVALSREVRFINTPSAVSNETQWVIVDRANNIFWHHPGLRNATDWNRYWAQGQASEEDLAVVKALRNDPRFQMVFDAPRLNQAVFRRIQSITSSAATDRHLP
jgi:hypothetical protein